MKPSLHKVDDDDDDDDDGDDDYYYYHYYYCYKSVRKLDPVLKQAGLRSPPIRSSSLSNCFKQAVHVPPFDVDGFETRDGKLVYNVLKKFSSQIKI